MTTIEMDKDLATYTDMESLSARVGYWNKRFALTAHDDEDVQRFNEIVAKHSRRVFAVLRAG
ncbi:hypothetical protein [Devosia sp.]|uniref:hypothetical protein n=1 Tax=Devosia sp. TaxID=1871048 RepID=UPI001AC10748|nr:hypothetical protein [Devosia sp.]MBN9332981.1 hypothetical protein [Devosia sp.]